MRCKCGHIVSLSNSEILTINSNYLVMCSNCNRMYNENEFSEHEISKSYWKNCDNSERVVTSHV